MSAQVSLLLVLPTTKSRFAVTFVRLVPYSPSFDKVGILLAAGCWLLLDAQDVEATLGLLNQWSSRRTFPGNSVSDTQAIKARNLCSDKKEFARWSDNSLSNKVAQGCGLLPIDNASETVGVVNEITETEETESKEHRTKTWHDKRWKTHHTLAPRVTTCECATGLASTHEPKPLSNIFCLACIRWQHPLDRIMSHIKGLHDAEIEKIAQITNKSTSNWRYVAANAATNEPPWSRIEAWYHAGSRAQPCSWRSSQRQRFITKNSRCKKLRKTTFANEHLVTENGPWMARPTSPQGGGYAFGCSPGPLKRSRSVCCGKCAASNGIACGRDNYDNCAKDDDHTLSCAKVWCSEPTACGVWSHTRE